MLRIGKIGKLARNVASIDRMGTVPATEDASTVLDITSSTLLTSSENRKDKVEALSRSATQRIQVNLIASFNALLFTVSCLLLPLFANSRSPAID